MELNNYQTIKETVTGEIVVKKSRFICEIRSVKSLQEANEFIAETKKKYYDARHNCSAYIIGPSSDTAKANDDGEPRGTAGKPMLEVLQGLNLTNVAAVVTRYFGGTLLGTGGLVRAYSDAVNQVLKNAKIITYQKHIIMELIADYSNFSKVQKYAYSNNLRINEPIYEDNIDFELNVPYEMREKAKEQLINITNGAIIIKKIEKTQYFEKNA